MFNIDFKTLKVGDDFFGMKIAKICLINGDPEFIVFIDERDRLQYGTKVAPTAEQNVLLRQIDLLDAIPRNELDEHQQASAVSLLGQATIATLLNDSQNAGTILELAKSFILTRRVEAARRNYCYAAFWGFGIAALAGIMAAANLGVRWSLVCEFLAAAVMGAVGAFTFAIWRWKERPLDPDSGRHMHVLDGSIRILMGALAGFLVMLLFCSGIDFQAVKFDYPTTKATAQQFYVVLLFCFVSGWSERWVPSLVESLEKQYSQATPSAPPPSSNNP